MTGQGMRGYVPIREVARGMSVSQRAAKRRLRRMQARINEPLLVRFSDGGNWFADVSILKRYLPGLFAKDGPDPLALALAEIVQLKTISQETMELVVELRDSFAVQPGVQIDHDRPSRA